LFLILLQKIQKASSEHETSFFKEPSNRRQDVILSKLFVIAIGKRVSSGDIFLRSERAKRNIPKRAAGHSVLDHLGLRYSNRSAVELWHEFSSSEEDPFQVL